MRRSRGLRPVKQLRQEVEIRDQRCLPEPSTWAHSGNWLHYKPRIPAQPLDTRSHPLASEQDDGNVGRVEQLDGEGALAVR